MSYEPLTECTSAAMETQQHLSLLRVERALAQAQGLDRDHAYMADLEDEITATTAAYIGLAVTEIASLRGQLSGPLVG